MDLSALKQAFAELVQSGPGLAEVDVLPAFPVGKHLPLAGPCVLLGVDGLEIAPGGLGGFSIEQGEASVTVRLDFFDPRGGGARLQQMYEALCSALMQAGAAFGLSRVWRDPITWDDAAGSYRLSARCLLRGRARPGTARQTDPTISGFRLARKDEVNDV